MAFQQRDLSGAVVKLKTVTDASTEQTLAVAPQILRVVYTDHSGSITTGGAAQTMMAANTSRNGFCIQNTSSADLWVGFVGTAAAGGSSLKLPAGTLYESLPHGVPTGAISIFGATTGQSFAAVEW